MGNLCPNPKDEAGQKGNYQIDPIFEHYDKDHNGSWEFENFVDFVEEMLKFTSLKIQRFLWLKMILAIGEGHESPPKICDIPYYRITMGEFRTFMVTNQSKTFIAFIKRRFDYIVKKEVGGTADENLLDSLPPTPALRPVLEALESLESDADLLSDLEDEDILKGEMDILGKPDFEKLFTRSAKELRRREEEKREMRRREELQEELDDGDFLQSDEDTRSHEHQRDPVGRREYLMNDDYDSNAQQNYHSARKRVQRTNADLLEREDGKDLMKDDQNRDLVNTTSSDLMNRRDLLKGETDMDLLNAEIEITSDPELSSPSAMLRRDPLRVLQPAPSEPKNPLVATPNDEGHRRGSTYLGDINNVIAHPELYSETGVSYFKEGGGRPSRRPSQAAGLRDYTHTQPQSYASGHSRSNTHARSPSSAGGRSHRSHGSYHERELTREILGLDSKHSKPSPKGDNAVEDTKHSPQNPEPPKRYNTIPMRDSMASMSTEYRVEFPIEIRKRAPQTFGRGDRFETKWMTLVGTDIFYHTNKESLLAADLGRVKYDLEMPKYSTARKLQDPKTGVVMIPDSRVIAIEIGAMSERINITTRIESTASKNKTFEFDLGDLPAKAFLHELKKRKKESQRS
uniref:EF-hand domain-containing protein n=2 Tax=Lotharella globosa TaxID=91324 RepID=A0A7S3Y984_9EUKA